MANKQLERILEYRDVTINLNVQLRYKIEPYETGKTSHLLTVRATHDDYSDINTQVQIEDSQLKLKVFKKIEFLKKFIDEKLDSEDKIADDLVSLGFKRRPLDTK